MRTKLKAVDSIGVIYDRDEMDLPDAAWTDCNNVRFKDGYVQSSYMHSGISFTTSADLILQSEYLRGTTSNLFVYAADTDADGVADSVLTYNGTTESDITGTTPPNTWTTTSASSTDYITSCQIHGKIIINNGFNYPVYWDGAAATVKYLPWDASNNWSSYDGAGATYTAKIIRPYKDFLVAMDITDDGTRNPRLIHWSSLINPGADWSTDPPIWAFNVASEESGRTELGQTTGFILDGLAMRDMFVVYKEDAIVTMRYSGGFFVQDFQNITDDKALLAANCVVEIQGRHLVLGQRDVYWFDGQKFESVIEGTNKKYLFSRIDQTSNKKNYAFLLHNIEDSEVWVCYPTADSTYADEAMVFSYVNNTWSKRDVPDLTCAFLGATITGDTQDWDDETDLDWDSETVLDWESFAYSAAPSLLYGAGTKFYKLDNTNQADGVSVTKYAERCEVMGGDNIDTWVLVTNLYPKVEGDPVTIKVGTQVLQDGPITWDYSGVFDPSTDYKIDLLVNGKFIAYRVESSDNSSWKFSGMDFDYVKSGSR